MKAHLPMPPDETAASLSGPARADALHALRVLSEAAESEETETPPLPEHLREQWLEAYGEPAKSQPAPAGESSSPPPSTHAGARTSSTAPKTRAS